jgi:hypothetical protein
MPIGEVEVEPDPLAVTQGEANVSRLGIEVERDVVGDEERVHAERHSRGGALPESPPMTFVERKRGVHGGAGMDPVDSMLTGQGLAKLRQGSEGGKIPFEGFADPAIDHETKVVHEGEKGGGKRRSEGTDEGAGDSHPGGTVRAESST